MTMRKYIAYVRVSTKEQGVSGLGMAAQVTQINNFVGAENVLKFYKEVESGFRAKKRRPRLDAAIRACKLDGYILVVAKLDRLGRNAVHLHALREDIEILVVDKPSMGTVEFSFYAGMAQEESERASARIKAALAEKRAGGWIPQSGKGFSEDCRKQQKTYQREESLMDEINQRGKQIIKQLLKEKRSYREIAKWLNDIGEETVHGKKYGVSSVQRIIKMYDLREGAVK